MRTRDYLVRVGRAKIDWQERQPDDARRVHGESDEFGFVEIFGYFARLDGVHGANGDEEHVEHLAEQEGRVLHFALELHLVTLRIRGTRPGGLHPHPQRRAEHLNAQISNSREEQKTKKNFKLQYNCKCKSATERS